jgi:hypothetical protein
MNTQNENINSMIIKSFPTPTPAPLVGLVSADIDFTADPYFLPPIVETFSLPRPPALTKIVSADIDFTAEPYFLSPIVETFSLPCPPPLTRIVSADIDFTADPYFLPPIVETFSLPCPPLTKIDFTTEHFLSSSESLNMIKRINNNVDRVIFEIGNNNKNFEMLWSMKSGN